MADDRIGQVAVIFSAWRNDRDEAGYDAAATTMARAAAERPGYRGIVSTRGADGFGITVSYWADDAAARAWRDDPDHARIREQGRALWYDAYTLVVAQVTRDYAWKR